MCRMRFAALRCLLSALILSGACGPSEPGGILGPAPGADPGSTDRTSGAPLIDAVSPGAGPSCGGSVVVVTGQNFASGALVTFGGAAATDVSVWSSTRLTARLAAVPGAIGPAEVVVRNPDGQVAARADLFRYHDCNLVLPTPLFDPGGRAALVVGDFNRDGRPDVVVSAGPMNIHVLLNDGKGGFSDPLTAVSGFTVAVVRAVAADFNGDQNLDLVLSRGISGTQASVLLGDGAGGFALPKVFATGGVNYASVVGDWNGDGKLDLAMINSSSLQTFMGDGTGGFSGAMTTAGTFSSSRLAAGDFNDDGKTDLVSTISGSKLNVLLSDGSGGFKVASMPSTPGGSSAVVVADLNGDKKLDLAASGSTAGTWTFLGDGTGGFGPGQPFSMFNSQPQSLSVLDLNRDQIPDLVACESYSTNSQGLWVLLGNGTGGFASVTRYFGGCSMAETADFNGDQNPDVITATSNGVVLYLGNGRGGLYAPTSFSSAKGPLAVADLDGDQNLDFVGDAGGTVVLTDGKGGVSATASGVPFNDSVVSLLLGDFNGDRSLDLAGSLAVGTSFGVGLKLGDGRGGFGPPVDLGLGSTKPQLLAAADLNGDQRDDLLVVDSTNQFARVVYGNGLGDLSSRDKVFIPLPLPLSVVTGDFNADRRPDVAVGQAGSVVILLGNGAGAFAAPLQWPIAGKASALATGDVNGDGRLDLAFTDSASGSSGLLLGDGQGGFISAGTDPIGASGTCVALADLNGDTKLDLLLPSAASKVLLGDGKGGFGRLQTYASLSCTTGEFTGDGKQDVLLSGAWLVQSQDR